MRKQRLRKLISRSHSLLLPPTSVSWVLPRGFSYLTVIILVNTFDRSQLPPALLPLLGQELIPITKIVIFHRCPQWVRNCAGGVPILFAPTPPYLLEM